MGTGARVLFVMNTLLLHLFMRVVWKGGIKKDGVYESFVLQCVHHPVLQRKPEPKSSKKRAKQRRRDFGCRWRIHFRLVKQASPSDPLERYKLSSYQGEHTGHECDADNLKSHKQTHKIPEDFKPWLDQLLYDATLSGCGNDGLYLPDE